LSKKKAIAGFLTICGWLLLLVAVILIAVAASGFVDIMIRIAQ
jgi:hypothetical protein